MLPEGWDAADAASLCGAVNRDRLMADLAEFARRVKLSGTAEELQSFHYLQARMDAAGFRTRLLSHQAYISLPGRSEVRVGEAVLPSITHSMARPTPPAGLSAPLVHVGDGSGAWHAQGRARPQGQVRRGHPRRRRGRRHPGPVGQVEQARPDARFHAGRMTPQMEQPAHRATTEG